MVVLLKDSQLNSTKSIDRELGSTLSTKYEPLPLSLTPELLTDFNCQHKTV